MVTALCHPLAFPWLYALSISHWLKTGPGILCWLGFLTSGYVSWHCSDSPPLADLFWGGSGGCGRPGGAGLLVAPPFGGPGQRCARCPSGWLTGAVHGSTPQRRPLLWMHYFWAMREPGDLLGGVIPPPPLTSRCALLYPPLGGYVGTNLLCLEFPTSVQ